MSCERRLVVAGDWKTYETSADGGLEAAYCLVPTAYF